MVVQGISKDISVEDLLRRYPASVRFLIQRNLPCLVCGEPVWGTLEDVASRAGYDGQQIRQLVADMNATLVKEDE
jgi:hypothetical protein